MAQMFPVLEELELRELERKSSAEAEVYRAFRDHTPSDWLVLHGLNLHAQSPGSPPRDAEADFVVFDSKRGFLVIEVKGGGVSRDAKGRWWSQGKNGKREIKDPIRQALSNKHHVQRNLQNVQGWGPAGAPWLLMGHAALFPDLGSSTLLTAHDRPQQILGTSSDVQRLSIWVDGVFNHWATNDTSWKPLGQVGMNVVRSVYCAQVTVQPLLALVIAREERRQIELTTRQTYVLQNLRRHSRAAVAGSAGTGKTLLALQHAKALATQGRRTLLVCYTRALADFLKREASGIEKLDVMQFHQLCDWRIEAVRQAKGIDLLARAIKSYPADDEFQVQKPYALALSADEDPMRYQAILVDEGQDFGDEYWLALELLLVQQEDAQFYVFYDPNQAIYQRSKGFPDLGTPLPLTENCRNTRPIHDATYLYYKGDVIAPPEVEGEPIKSLPASGLQAQARIIKDTVSDLLQNGGLKPDQIVVLIVGERKDEHFGMLHSGGDPTGARWSFERLWQPKCVLVDTVRRFKGLEAVAVILWCSEDVDAAVERELLYVALSRARNRLWVVGNAARVAKVLKGP